jgi:hypothetical protein
VERERVAGRHEYPLHLVLHYLLSRSAAGRHEYPFHLVLHYLLSTSAEPSTKCDTQRPTLPPCGM